MTGYRIDMSRIQQLDVNSEVLSGAKLYVFSNTTTTPVALFSDRAATVSAANPIVADSAGRFPIRYVNATSLLTYDLDQSNDVDVWSDDDQEPVPNIANADLANYAPLVGADFTGLVNWAPQDSVASATTVNADALDSNYATVTGTTTIANITLADGAERLFIFAGICTLTDSSTLMLGGADITTHAGMLLRFVGESGGITRLTGGITATGKAIFESVTMIIPVIGESTALTTGTAKITFRAPFAMVLDAIPRISLTTAQSSGTVVTVDVNVGGVSVLTVKATIDNNETTSTTAATAATLTAATVAIADDAQITVDIDECDGSTTAKGLKLTMLGYRQAS